MQGHFFNILPHGDNSQTPYERFTGRKPDLSNLHIFGCRMYAIDPTKKDGKQTTDFSVPGRFMGYGGSMKIFLILKDYNKEIGRCTHAAFDEANLDAPEEKLTPSERALWNALSRSGGDPPDTLEIITPPQEASIFSEGTPYLQTRNVTIPIKCTCPLLGLKFESDPLSKRNIIVGVMDYSSATHVPWEDHLISHTVLLVGDVPVFTVREVTIELEKYDVMDYTSVTIEVAPHLPDEILQEEPLPQITTDQLRAIHSVITGISDPTECPVLLVTEKNASNMAGNGKLTRKKCLSGPESQEWKDCHFSQLDKQDSYGMYGTPCPRRMVPKKAKIVHLIWNYTQKADGTKKTHDCMNGKQLKRQGMTMGHTYAACMEQHNLKLITALSAVEGNILLDADVVNAYSHTDAQGIPIYIIVDDIFQEWYLKHHGVKLALGDCVPILKALQGHPEAGKWWGDLANKHLADMGFMVAPTEPSIYHRKIEGKFINQFLLRQVDDCLLSVPSVQEGMDIFQDLGTRVKLKYTAEPTKLFYATTIVQTARYVQITAKDYIRGVMIKLGWDPDPQGKLYLPLSPTRYKTIAAEQGPLEGTPEAIALVKSHGHGYTYKTLLGYALFAMVIARPDLDEALGILAKFGNRPAPGHYTALFDVLKYMRDTQDIGPIQWRPRGKELAGLPYGDIHPMHPESFLASLYPQDHPLHEIIIMVDAAFNNLTDMGEHKSTSGVVIMLNGTFIHAKRKLQTTIALSSTEAEIRAGCMAGKLAKYFRKLMSDLGYPPPGPTKIYEDNQGTIQVSNHNRPSGRTKHIDREYFATQEWVQQKLIIYEKIDTKANVADAITKLTHRILFQRHFYRMFGYYGSSHAKHDKWLPNPNENPPKSPNS